ncbi:MAG: gliding motility-associated ABC transporter substrate-binding protein GldG [Dysgonamonadaceae bacterium]|jgi:ABC-2 type transport system permease protein|nr:gliding motility-associated ABC transporter substrate-binding protein GldG [Dysgonamonadaceae bacterium]
MILLYKEIKSFFNTSVGLFFLLSFLLVAGLLLWSVPGAYHIPGSTYASLDNFFALLPVLLSVLIPVFSINIFSGEKKHRTLELLLTRPIRISGIVAAKTLAIFLIVLLTFLLSLSYLFTISYFAIPQGNVDWGAIGGAYFGFLFLSLTFVSITVLASSLTSNQVMAFIVALFACVGSYYGFELLSLLFASGETQLFIKKFGLFSHVVSMQRGVIDSRDLVALLSLSACCFTLTCGLLSVGKRKKMLWGAVLILLLPNMLSANFHFRWDLTSEKRYTLSEQSGSILKALKEPLTVEIYLDGALNAGFTRLKEATVAMLSEFSLITPVNLQVRMIDPYQSKEPDFISHLAEAGIKGIAVNERDMTGKVTQKIVFPYLKITDGEAALVVPLLIHSPYKSGEENLNTSIENIEYQLISNIYRWTEKRQRKIAFLEGHAEFADMEIGDVTEMLSHYYQIDRGQLSNDIHQLSDYDCVILAGPQMPFSEQEKFILDQYLMKGGTLLFLVNGVKLLPDQLAATGQTPSMVNDVHLDDMLFTYGIRINPVLVEDLQCLNIPVKTELSASESDFQPLPWHFAPVLYPANNHPVSKDLMLIKSEFVSSLSFVGQRVNLQQIPLLYTSGQSHLVPVPDMITFRSPEEAHDASRFTAQQVMVAALLEGKFTSVFNHRSVPEGIDAPEIMQESVPTKIIVAGTEEIIRNDVERTASGEKLLPAGYDKYMDIQFGNREFMLNAVNYLTDNEGLMNLKDKHLKIRLLDKNRLQQAGSLPIWINAVCPLAFISALFLINYRTRRKKYFK